MKHVASGRPGILVEVAPRNESFIGGTWLAPAHSQNRVDGFPATHAVGLC
jgi:hypothetical protein